jgi:diadenylate cyclase
MVSTLLFLQFRWVDALDIFLVSIVLYQLYQIVKGTVALRIFFAMLVIYVLYWLVEALDMHVLSSLLGQFTGLGMLAFILVFQQEVRRFLILLGSNAGGRRLSFLRRFFPDPSRSQGWANLDQAALETALTRLSASKTGALMVFLRNSELRYYARSGVLIDATLTAPLLEQLFFKNTPLHDGAALIKGNKILRARCMLPLTENHEMAGNKGMRHKAAIGISEVSDAIAVTVSEETGDIALAVEGKLFTKLTPKEVVRKLTRPPSAS